MRAQHEARVAELRAEHEAAEAAAAEAAAEAAAPKGAVVPVDVAIDECVVRPLRECRRVLGRACVLFFVREHKLLDHLGAPVPTPSASADFLGLSLWPRRSGASPPPRSAAPRRRAPPRRPGRRPKLRRLSLRSPPKEATAAAAAAAHGAGRRDAAEALVLNFELPAPVDLLVDGAAMDQYSRVFRFLLPPPRALALRALSITCKPRSAAAATAAAGRRTRARRRRGDAHTAAARARRLRLCAKHRGALRGWRVPQLLARAARARRRAGSAAEPRGANDYLADATRQCFLHPAGAPTAAVVSAVFGVVALPRRRRAGVARVARHVEGALPPADARAGDGEPGRVTLGGRDYYRNSTMVPRTCALR